MMMNTHSSEKRKAESYELEGPNKKKLPIENDANDVQANDIISLNVGGETMACCRSTLVQVEGSFLASMFSGRWENQQLKDKDGNIFLNFEPAYFKLILKFLRSKEISSPEYPPPTPVPTTEDFPHFYNLVNYLGLRAEFKAKVAEREQKESFDDNYVSNICINDPGSVVKFGYHNKCHDDAKIKKLYVTSDTGYFDGHHQWKLMVNSWDEPESVFIGVVEQDDNYNLDKIYYIWDDKGANGWIGKRVIQNGKSKPNESVICVGVLHILTLDLDAMTLSLANGRDTVNMKLQRAKDPEDETYGWSLCVGFQPGTKSEVRLVEIN